MFLCIGFLFCRLQLNDRPNGIWFCDDIFLTESEQDNAAEKAGGRNDIRVERHTLYVTLLRVEIRLPQGFSGLYISFWMFYTAILILTVLCVTSVLCVQRAWSFWGVQRYSFQRVPLLGSNSQIAGATPLRRDTCGNRLAEPTDSFAAERLKVS